MILSDRQIEYAVLSSGDIGITPYENELLQPASYDVRLGTQFMRYTLPIEHIDPEKGHLPLTKIITTDDTLIRPGEFILATTLESVYLSTKYAAQLNGKSTLGRLGLVVHATAGFIDPGFMGNITLELTNFNKHPIILRPGMKIAQLHFLEMSETPRYSYGQRNNHYQGQDGVTGPAILS